MISPFSWKTSKKGSMERTKKIKLPLEISVWHKSCGFHSALIVEYEPRTDSLRVANFKGSPIAKGGSSKRIYNTISQLVLETVLDRVALSGMIVN